MGDPATVRIGGAAGFWGDSSVGPAQLVADGTCRYLVFDYLAELTMSILARAQAKDPALGYATDFIRDVIRPLASGIKQKGMRLVTNAGGMNPLACAAAIEAAAEAAGVSFKLAVVTGDDLLPEQDRIRARQPAEMFSGIPFPASVASLNAYLGAFPIARALDEGADIVVTGRAVDSALALGVLVHEFGWRETDFDRLAAGSLVGHMLECGTQATGGLYTDWREVGPFDQIGFPIAECSADGSFLFTKAQGSGGYIAPGSVTEQMLYEVGDPARYALADVVCDFTSVTIVDAGKDCVRFAGARGRAPNGSYKVTATYLEGYRSASTLTVVGREAAGKGRAVADAILSRARSLLRNQNIGDFTETLVEVLGSESSAYGASANPVPPREVVVRIAVRHADQRALDIFAREFAPFGTSGPPGTTGFGGRAKPTPVYRLFSFLVPRESVAVEIGIGGQRIAYRPAAVRDVAGPDGAATRYGALPLPGGPTTDAPLYAMALARSGDKGDISNVAVIARHPDFLPVIQAEVTPARVKAYLDHLVRGEVERFDVPGVQAFNFLLREALGGGGAASLRNDPLGKAFAQILLDMPVPIPEAFRDHPALAH